MAVNTTGVQTQSAVGPVSNVGLGKIVFDATAIVAADVTRVTCGFKPRYVYVMNVTSRISVEFFEGMAANTAVKTAAVGTVTSEVVGLTMRDDGFEISQNATLAIILASQTLQWLALG